jgi:hypothetical protein
VTQVDEGPESPGTPGVLTFGAPAVGEVLAERYELQEHINDDAFGRQVWRGVDVVLRRPVAVIMRYPGGGAAVEMLDAAVAASRVVHSHLVDVYDAIDEGSRAYVVREWVDGGSLREFVAEAPFDGDRATMVTSAIASAVAAIHATGMAHGNIHAGTVLIGSDGRVVLSDARADEATTPDADVRAIGAVLYCALSGHWPHAEAGASSLPDAARDPAGAVVPLRQIRGGIPAHLSDLAADLLDTSVAPPSADVLSAELSRLEGDREEAFFSVGGPLDFEQPAYPGAAPVLEPRRSVRKLAIGVAVLLVLAMVGLLVTINALSDNKNPTGTSPTTPGLASAGGNGGSTQTNGRPTLLAISPDKVRVVDPDGTGSELRGAEKTVDNDRSSVWKSEHYKNSPTFGNSKSGMGILIDLGAPKAVATVQVDFVDPGVTVELRGSNTDPGSQSRDNDKKLVANFERIGEPVTANNSVVFNSDGRQVRYLLVWVTRLAVSVADGRNFEYIVQIQNIAVTASPS